MSDKIITSGGGGMLVTNNYKYAKKAKYLSTQAFNNVKKHIEKSDNLYLTKGMEEYNLMISSLNYI